MVFDDADYTIVKKKASLTRGLTSLPEAASIKQYAPTPKSQGAYSTCVAWASAYCGKTIVEAIKHNLTDKAAITAGAYSPAFLFRLLSPEDTNCAKGTSISNAFELMKGTGLIHFSDLSTICTPVLSETQLAMAPEGKIKDYIRIFDLGADEATKIQAVKKSISEQKPVVFGMLCPDSFNAAKELWTPKEEPSSSMGGHAMCVVGYDDQKFGGAFEIQNSWGTNWGLGGYTWIKYADYARFTKYAYEFVDLPEAKAEEADLSGSIRLTLADGKDMPVGLLTSTRGLKVVPAKQAPGPLSVYQTNTEYTSGTRFRILISNNEPAYVYAISTDLSNEITKIFPFEDGISAALTDKKNDVSIPDEDHFIEFDNKPGKDLLCVLYSRDEIDLNDLIKKIQGQEGSFSARIFKVLEQKLVAPSNIQFSKDKIAFQGFSKGKTIIPMIVEMAHK